MRLFIRYIFFGAVVSLFASCSWDDKTTPGYEYMPDMYRSPSYETYSPNPLFADSSTARQPVAGTIARGNAIFTDYDRMPYPYADSPEGYEEAGAKLKNPFPVTPEAMADGKILYQNYCMHCHAANGDGNGPVVQNNGPRPPAYNSDQLKDLPEGKMYHTITYGKNMMGSHASQVTPTQRWKIIMYIQTLQKPAGNTAAADAGTAGQKS